jgi:hypothetical protein
LLAAFASPIFMLAAIAGWLYGVWPANPLTLGVAAFLVVGGPLLGIVHVATAKDDDEAEAQAAPTVVRAAARPAVTPRTAVAARTAVTPRTAVAERPVVAPRPVPEPVILTPKAAAARRFAAWRDKPHPAIERRERERRASQYLRS